MRKKKQQQDGGAHRSVEERECLAVINIQYNLTP